MAKPNTGSVAYVIPKRLWDRVHGEWKTLKEGGKAGQTGGTVVGTTSRGVEPEELLHALAVNASLSQSPKMEFVKYADQAIKKILDDPSLSSDGKIQALEAYTTAYRAQRIDAKPTIVAAPAAGAVPQPPAPPATPWSTPLAGSSGTKTPASSVKRRRMLPETPPPTPREEELQSEIDALNKLRKPSPEQIKYEQEEVRFAAERHGGAEGDPARPVSHTLPVDTTVEKTRYELFTQSEITTSPLQIKVDPTRRWVDLNKTLFVFTVKFVANDGTTLLTSASKVAPINLIGHSLIKQFDVSFNKTLVSSGTADYHYAAYFDRLLKYSAVEKNEVLTLEGWYTDTPNKFDDTDPLERAVVAPTANTTAEIRTAIADALNRATPNAGAAGRHGLCCQNRRVAFVISPVIGIFDQVKYLTPGTQIDFRVRWNSAALALMTGNNIITTPKFRIVPQTPEVWIYHVEANPQLHIQNEAAMLQHQQLAIYPFMQKRIVTHTIVNGRRRETFPNVFQGFKPNYMIVGLLRGDAYTGDYARSPYNFHDMNQKQIKCIGITREGYKDGNFLLLWNFNPDGALNAGYTYGRNVGNVKIEVDFSADTANNITLIVCGEFEQELWADGSKNFSLRNAY
ncbi:hypothetical protein QZH41_000331 [Actinostola sp. cb2023]|nr:hypothetical protein QZH41_000331 [Actinostola sp. cb2023]